MPIARSTISVPQSIFNYFRELVYLVVFLNGIQEHSIKNQFVIFDFDSITMQPHNISRKSVLPRGEYNVENLKLIQKHHKNERFKAAPIYSQPKTFPLQDGLSLIARTTENAWWLDLKFSIAQIHIPIPNRKVRRKFYYILPTFLWLVKILGWFFPSNFFGQ